MVISFLKGCDRGRYGKLLEDLENEYVQGRNKYPSSVSGAYNMVLHWSDGANKIKSIRMDITNPIKESQKKKTNYHQ